MTKEFHDIIGGVIGGVLGVVSKFAAQKEGVGVSPTLTLSVYYKTKP